MNRASTTILPLPAPIPSGSVRTASVVADLGELRFSAAVIIGSTTLQRFGVFFGTSYLDCVGPIGLMLACMYLFSGALVLHRQRMLLFALLCFVTLVSAAAVTLVKSAYGGEPSISSLIQFLVLNSFATLTFARPVNEADFFRVVNRWLAFVTVAGLIQFVLQFARIDLFSFTSFVPDSALVEQAWNVVIPIGTTYYHKSNGFFLLEPSLFSQFSAIALIIEILVVRRLSYLCLFSAGLITSVSGTGWLMIVGFVLTAVLSLGGRGVIVAVATAAAGFLALAGLFLASPEIYGFFIGRISEFDAPGSSAHLRFVTPWWFASDVISNSPLALLFGIGAGVSEHPGQAPAYYYNVNSVVKLLLEFGAPALITFLTLFFANQRTRVQTALVAPVMVWVLSDGGNVETAFVLFPALLLIVTADLRAETA